MKLFKKTKKTVKPKSPKRVKKNTIYRKFRALVLRIEHRQMNDTPPIRTQEAATLVCQHCGRKFTGAYCPSCGMPARWKRFNWRLLFLNFLDIWGFGNRSMFRTIRDLFWRPGYMMRDYLRGHHLSYFPPFKMLAVWTVLILFMMWLLKDNSAIEPEQVKSIAQNALEKFGGKMSSASNLFLDQIQSVLDYLNEHMLYSIIIQNLLVVLAVKWAFHRVSDFNLVETFFSQIYINCQFHILAFVSMLLTWRATSFVSVYPYMHGIINPLLVLAYDFHQLYRVTWKKALWKTIETTIYILLLYGVVILLIIFILYITERVTNPASPLFQQ